jgi:hypothetical protein
VTDDATLQHAIERLTASVDKLEAKVVLQVQYVADKEAAADHRRFMSDKVSTLEKKVDADIADRKADRRLIIAAFLALIAQIILQVYQQAQGGPG